MRLQSPVDLRNRLVHEYGSIDNAMVLAAVGTMLKLYRAFIEAVEGFLVRSGVSDVRGCVNARQLQTR
ncbi:MAG: DUF86 domain-containing protein [Acidobacteria bacterium]|nr:DUF86 domain-containing protein [Acidobacteriota bacterium]